MGLAAYSLSLNIDLCLRVSNALTFKHTRLRDFVARICDAYQTSICWHILIVEESKYIKLCGASLCSLQNWPNKIAYCVPNPHNMLPDSIVCTIQTQYVTRVVHCVGMVCLFVGRPWVHTKLHLKKKVWSLKDMVARVLAVHSSARVFMPGS